MSDQMLTKIIDELSKRLGTAYDITASAIEQYTQLRAMQSIYITVMFGILLIVALIVFVVLVSSRIRNGDPGDSKQFAAAFVATIAVILLIVLVIMVFQLLGWCLHPQGMLVQEIIQAVR
ncbi:hypothetical protein [Lancefieldella rimae]|uniref:hypothetical protein n=1 Tax=Lancefieldella rimae TaxID=1383 RepID=UPI0023559B55|nr:hypothetical protein [Lancefieldella rimae]